MTENDVVDLLMVRGATRHGSLYRERLRTLEKLTLAARRRAQALFLRAGGERKLTYRKIGEEMGVGPERTRQLVHESLTCLRAPHRNRVIKERLPEDHWLRRAVFHGDI